MSDNKIKTEVNFFSRIIYAIFGGALLIACKLMFGYKIFCDKEVKQWKKSKESFVVLCAHPSEFDAVVLLTACFPRFTRFVAGAQQLYKGTQGKLLQLIRVIPKKQFTADIYAVKEMMKTVKNGYVLGFMPEGRVSMDGCDNPCDMATAKLLKKMRVPVAVLIPHGTYFVKPPYNYKGIKKGKISAELKPLFTKDELDSLSENEIFERLNSACSYNACEELRGQNIHYKSKKNNAFLGVSNILYRCPECGKLYTLKDNGDRIYCSNCKSTAELGKNMFIKGDNNSFPDSIALWNKTQTIFEKEFWKDDNAAICFSVSKYMIKLGEETDYRYCCEGKLSLDKNGLHYKDGEENIDESLESLQGLSADYQHGFITFYKGNDIRRFKLEDSKYAARIINSLMVLKGLK